MTQRELLMAGVGDRAPDAAIRDADGNPVQLSRWWRDQPVALVFVRHFG
jgi:peroxiredoxin